MSDSYYNPQLFVSPTTELEAVNIMLSSIGETPVNSLREATHDVSVAYNTLAESSKAIQLDGYQWNTEDDYPLVPNAEGRIELHPSIIRVAFREPDDRELVLRGNKVYDRVNHTYIFEEGTRLLVTATFLLPFDDLPEAARRYITIRAARIFQERVVGSPVITKFQELDEARARTVMMLEERRQDRPNMMTGTLAPIGTWRPHVTMRHRGLRRY